MINDLYFVILKKLKNGGGVLKTTDLSESVKEYFSDERNIQDPVWLDVKTAIDEIFTGMKESGHIKSFTNSTPQHLAFTDDFKYLNEIKIEAQLAIGGYTYYEERRKNSATRIIAVLALIISGIMALINWASYTNKQNVTPEKTNKSPVEIKK